MIDRRRLLDDLKKWVNRFEDDLRAQCGQLPETDARLRAQYDAARAARRTAATYAAWRDDLLTQVAAAWVLASVFVRFLEDNDLLDASLISGPGNRRTLAGDAYTLYFREQPAASARDYLEHVFRQVAGLPTLGAVFDTQHNPLWIVPISGDAAAAFRDFWRTVDPATGELRHDFTTPEWDTRFLGDLYQDLSEDAQKRYALLQTPTFVEEFILDRTLTPAIETFGLETARMIDPTCGSGHFLLGGFSRILDLWLRREPNAPIRELVQRALDAVAGVDLNPFAVAIARFRLLIAALRACDVHKLKNAPAFRMHLAVGDSLLHGPGHEYFPGGIGVIEHGYSTEDLDQLRQILGQRYHAVVGNPPYITVKDKALNKLYRERFGSCSGKYSLAAPFMELFFYLAPKGGGGPDQPAGFVGMITTNAFMKREFGKILVERFISKWDLTHVIDTSGAYIPGHGTPTVIILGKHQLPMTASVRTVMGIKGEPCAPRNPAQGAVWTAILGQVDHPGTQSEFISVADVLRTNFGKHPWSIKGGGASELKVRIDSAAASVLTTIAQTIGPVCFAGLDDIFEASPGYFPRQAFPPSLVFPFSAGEQVRDWLFLTETSVFAPYASDASLIPIEPSSRWYRCLWPARALLESVVGFARTTRKQAQEPWHSWYRWIPERVQ